MKANRRSRRALIGALQLPKLPTRAIKSSTPVFRCGHRSSSPVLLVLAIEVVLASRSRVPLPPLVIRAAALGALILALLNPRLFQSTTALDVVLDVDLSRSVGQEAREKGREVLEATGRAKRPETRTGMVVFGRAPEWEFLPRENFPAGVTALRLDREETDIQAALQASLAQIGEGRQGKILLISDGNENRGEISRIIPLLRSHGTQVWTLPVSLSRGRNEVYVSDLAFPRQVDSGEGFEIAGKIESLRDAPARVKLIARRRLDPRTRASITVRNQSGELS